MSTGSREAQYNVLDVARRIPRIEVIGGPGTGKTWLAIEQARRWSSEGQRVALVCYSRGLSTWIARRVSHWPKALRRNVRVRTYHALGVEWGVEIGNARDQEYWDVTMPAQMTELARALPDEQRFDALIVDEAQDCPDAWWPSLLASLRDPEKGRIAVFADEQQRIFDRDDRPDLGLVPLTLDANLRNSRQIGAVFAPLASDTPELLGGEGPPVRFIQCRAAEAMETADDAAVELLDQGWDPQDVALLTTHHRHPEQANRVELDGRDGYWDSFWDGTDLFFSTVAAFKGLERPAIVLAVDGFRDPVHRRRDPLRRAVARPRPADRLRRHRPDPQGGRRRGRRPAPREGTGRMTPDEARGEFDPEVVYCNTATLGLPPRRTSAALESTLADWRSWPFRRGRLRRRRRAGARRVRRAGGRRRGFRGDRQCRQPVRRARGRGAATGQ